jgi:hypothetical protein
MQAECPQTSNGNASRFNAVKHGLTAKTAVLPGEDPAAFEANLVIFKAGLKARNPFEEKLAANAALASWRLDRANRCEVSRITQNILTKSESLEHRQENEAIALGNRLFFDRRAPSQLYPSRDFEHKQARTSSSGEADEPDDPAKLVLELQRTVSGCRWLINAWSELRDKLESGSGWSSCSKFKAVRLLGKQPLDSVDDRRVALVFLASHAIEPEYSHAFQELRCEIHEEQFKRKKTVLDRWSRRGIAPANATAARAALLALVDEAIARLREVEAERQKTADELARLQNDILSVEDSKAGENVRLHLDRCDRLLHRNIEAVRKLRRDEAEGWGRTRRERQRRNAGWMNDEAEVEKRPYDDRLVIDEQGDVRSAEEYVEAGLARYDLELGHGPPGRVRPPRPVVREDIPPPVPDFAHWIAEEKRKRQSGAPSSLDARVAKPGDGTSEPLARPDDRIPVMLAGNGERAKMQNEIAGGECGSRAEVEIAAERQEARSYAGALERGNSEGDERCGADAEGAAERPEGHSHAGALKRGNTEGELRSEEETFGRADGVVGGPRRTEEGDCGTGGSRASAAVPVNLVANGEGAKVQNENGEGRHEARAEIESAAERREGRSYPGALEPGETAAVEGCGGNDGGGLERQDRFADAGALERAP